MRDARRRHGTDRDTRQEALRAHKSDTSEPPSLVFCCASRERSVDGERERRVVVPRGGERSERTHDSEIARASQGV